MAAVVELADVSVVRGDNRLLDNVTGRSRTTSAGSCSAPTAPARPPCSRSLSTNLYPTEGVVGVLGEVLGTVDVFELRPRIGLTSAALADRIPRGERVSDVVVSASYAVVGRWREEYDELDHERAAELLAEVGVAHLARPHVRHAERGGAQAGPDRPRPDDRPRAAAARRAGGRPRPRRPRGPGEHAVGAGARRPCRRRRCWSATTSRRSRPASPTSCCCAQGEVVAAGPLEETLTEEALTETFGLPLELVQHGRPLRRASHDRRHTAAEPLTRRRSHVDGLIVEAWTGCRTTPGRPG